MIINLEQLRCKILKKLRTASLNSKFTGSYIRMFLIKLHQFELKKR